jgi:hypothetical protein
MIARIWRGATREADKDTYFEYLQKTGLKEYAAVAGNQGVWVLRRIYEGKSEFTLISLWDSWDAIKDFAGPDYESAVYYPEDESFWWNEGRRFFTTRSWLRRSSKPVDQLPSRFAVNSARSASAFLPRPE